MSPNAALYEQDFYAWTQTTAALIRAGKWQNVDPASIAEELESVGRSERHAFEHRVEVLLRHLLKWQYQSERRARGRSWRSTIREQRYRLARLLQSSPSLGPLLAPTLQDEYAHARQRASDETGLPLATFPETCPWQAQEVLDVDFWPEA